MRLASRGSIARRASRSLSMASVVLGKSVAMPSRGVAGRPTDDSRMPKLLPTLLLTPPPPPTLLLLLLPPPCVDIEGSSSIILLAWHKNLPGNHSSLASFAGAGGGGGGRGGGGGFGRSLRGGLLSGDKQTPNGSIDTDVLEMVQETTQPRKCKERLPDLLIVHRWASNYSTIGINVTTNKQSLFSPGLKE